ncbi:hypothetical protein AK830_g49 [Neonectria ditissima]|uniref:Uncharacterized protein n=1 Tax=Neonectria ditissima TaxID=78410 RepID=A0A0P7BMH2_9HYPO|nr:hypothetical protein AK830_g49 [Neonectria ditissima]
MPKAPSPRRSERLKRRYRPMDRDDSPRTSTPPITRGRRHREAARQATDNQDPSSPMATIRLAVQPRPADAPLELELRFQRQTSRLETTPVQVYLRTPDRATFHRLAGPSAPGKRRLDSGEEPRVSAKRRRSTSPPSGGGGTGDAGTEEVQFEARGEQNASEEMPGDGYVVDLGLVSIFPAAPQNGQGYYVSEAPLRRVIPVILVVFPAMCVFFIVINVATMVFHSNPVLRPAMHRPRHISLQPVDWFEQAMWLEVRLSSMARMTLLGERELEEPVWQCLPGLRPTHGPLHSLDSATTAQTSYQKWDPRSPFYPRYKPWETTSTGVYVPEFYFARDVETVAFQVLDDLDTIANHGPPWFLFKKGTSTQFRWSTSMTQFVAPHEALPTLDDDTWCDDSTIDGMPPTSPGDPHPFPTARPFTTRWICNLEPGVQELRANFTWIIQRLAAPGAAMSAENDVLSWQGFTGRRSSTLVGRLRALQSRLHEMDQDWASDQCRVSCLHPKSTVDLAGPRPTSTSTSTCTGSSTGTMPLPTEIPWGIPDGFIDQARRAESKRRARSSYWEASARSYAPAASSPTCSHSLPTSCEPEQLPDPYEWSAAQKTNKTALEILNIVNKTIAQQYRRTEKQPRAYADILNFRDVRTRACKWLRSLDGHVQQVTDALQPESMWGTLLDEDELWEHRETREAVARLHDVAPFLSEIAVPRLCEMSARAERGAMLMEETEQRQRELQQELNKVIQDGWVVNSSDGTTAYLHFPAWTSFLPLWMNTSDWLVHEADNVSEVFYGRTWDFMRRRLDENNSRVLDEIIWSRWSLKDARKDPEGGETLCWGQRGVKEPKRGGNSWWDWFSRRRAKNSEQKGKSCGNPARRHG